MDRIAAEGALATDAGMLRQVWHFTDLKEFHRQWHAHTQPVPLLPGGGAADAIAGLLGLSPAAGAEEGAEAAGGDATAQALIILAAAGGGAASDNAAAASDSASGSRSSGGGGKAGDDDGPLPLPRQGHSMLTGELEGRERKLRMVRCQWNLLDVHML